MKQFIGREEDYLTGRDGVLLFVLLIVYGIISFIRLGSTVNPQTFWESFATNEKIVLTLENKEFISKARIFTGPVVKEYTLYLSDSKDEIGEKIGDFEKRDVLSWEDITINKEGTYLSVVAKTKGSYLGEVALYNKENQRIGISSEENTGQLLVDEQQVVPDKVSYLNSTYFDEVYHARTAYEHVYGLKPYEWTHPPLGKVIMGIPVKLWGMNPFNYRLMGNLAGIGMIAIIYILAKRMFKDTRYAFLAGLMMACDGMHFVQTRIATIDSYLVFFTMLSYLFMYEYMRCTQYDALSKRLIKLLLSGAFMGCAIATKWTGTYAALGLCILFFYDFIKKSQGMYDRYIWKRQATKIILWCFVFFIFIPVGIYVASYLPFFRTPDSGVNSFKELLGMQQQMYNYHSKLTATHPFSSEWYSWPLNIRPMWYYDGKGVMAGNVSTIAAFGNPIIWWVGCVGILYTLKEAIASRKASDLFIVVAIATAYIPYVFIGRVMFIYHYFPVVPFMMLATVRMFKNYTDGRNNSKLVGIFAIAIVASFLFFYPVYSGLEVPEWYVVITSWLPSWNYH